MPRRNFKQILAAVLALAFSWPFPQAHADVPRYLNYQGKLADASGNPLTGSYCFQFQIWDSLAGGSRLFGPETWSTGGTGGGNNPVSVVNGIYSLQIGSLTAGGIAPGVFDNPDAFLEVAVKADSSGCESPETLSPREHLVAVPYAVHSLTSEKLGTGVNIATFTSAGLMVFPGGVNASTMTLSGSAFSVGGSTLVVAGGNVGIGTTDPAARLDANGTLRALSQNFPSSGVGAEVSWDGSAAILRGYDRTNFLYKSVWLSGSNIAFWINGSTKTVIDSSGNVGIGTTGPAATLHVSSAASSPTTLLMEVSSGTAEGQQLLVIQADGNVGLGKTGPSFMLDVNGIVNSTGLYVNGSPYLGSQWTTSGSDIYYTAGKVGIGTTDPGEKLTVQSDGGSLRLQSTASGKHTFMEYWADGIGGGRSAYVGFGGDGDPNFTIANQKNSGHIVLTPGSGGNVGIGTTGPTEKLEVLGGNIKAQYGVAAASGTFTATGDSQYSIITSSSISVGGQGGSALYLMPDGQHSGALKVGYTATTPWAGYYSVYAP